MLDFHLAHPDAVTLGDIVFLPFSPPSEWNSAHWKYVCILETQWFKDFFFLAQFIINQGVTLSESQNLGFSVHLVCDENVILTLWVYGTLE